MKKMKIDSRASGERQSERLRRLEPIPQQEIKRTHVEQTVDAVNKLKVCQALDIAYDLDEKHALTEKEERSQPSDISSNYNSVKKRHFFSKALNKQAVLVFNNPKTQKRLIRFWWGRYQEAKKHCLKHSLELHSLNPEIIFPPGGKQPHLPKFKEQMVVQNVKDKANTFAPCTVEGLIFELQTLYQVKHSMILDRKKAEHTSPPSQDMTD